MNEVVSLEGPVEKDGEELVLKIPLDAGWAELVGCSLGIAVMEDGHLKIVIQEWLAGLLRIEEGDLVNINNFGGKFTISAVSPRPVH
jgi:hypothetical protein